MTGSGPSGPRWRTRLECGTELVFRASTFLPAAGESVPCPRHGYCSVVSIEDQPARVRPVGARVRARPRTCDELLDHLRHEGVVTVGRLRQQRFTLRLIAAAARTGHVAISGFEPEAEVVLERGPGAG